ncbi:MAG: oligopeptide transporter, OPT family [Selenomonadaceae bacterium]|nr:oligopeptide transporter, OPT family [Selenomonadaceae bacterium]
MLLGAILTVIFTASNVYLGLRIGLTFSSAIPAAVISMAVLKWAKDSNILENNMVQTQASAAGTISTIIFIVPGLLMLGYWQGFDFWQTFLVSACGGCIGVIFTIPLRRAMVTHSNLPYPEGLAAAEILKAGSGDKEHSDGVKDIAAGAFLSALAIFMSSGLKIISDAFFLFGAIGRGFSQLAFGYSAALLGAGYLIGIGAGIAILTGVIVTWVVVIPCFTWGFTGSESELIEAMYAAYRDKARLIGVGVMAVAAIWTVIGLTRPVVEGVKEAFARLNLTERQSETNPTDTDMSLRSVAVTFGITAVLLLLVFYSFVHSANLSIGQEIAFTFVGVGVALFIGFFVAAACAYMAGLVGTSSSPISGIGIIGIVVSSLTIMWLANSSGVFDLPWGRQFATATAIFTTTIIIAISCISNDNMQDLKTGFIVGAAPWKQQLALILGCVVGSLVIAPVLNLLYQAYGFTGAMPREGMDEADALAAPQASLMTALADGIFSGNLLWDYIFIGIGIGIILIIIDFWLKKVDKSLTLPPLAVGMGIYLPPEMETPAIVGAIIGYVVKKVLAKRGEIEAQDAERRGTLFASGLIVGESLMGVALAGIIVVSVTSGGSDAPLALGFSAYPDILGMLMFMGIIALFVKTVLKR